MKLRELITFILLGISIGLHAQQRALVLGKDSTALVVLAQNGFRVNAVIGNIYSVQWQGQRLAELKKLPGIVHVEYGERAVPSKATDSLSLSVTRVSQLHTNYTTYGFPQAVTGNGVIVGIVDVGFQPSHPTFKDKLGIKNRVVRFWDQTNNTGTPPQGYAYGSLHTDVSQAAHKNTESTHGTHVAGIAAGSGYGSPNFNQGGMAPDADIVMVQILFKNDTIPAGARSDYLLANPAIIDAFDYIFKYADSVDKPAVINLSWGMHTGPHDGTSLFDQAVDGLVDTGKVIVGAAGNDRGRNTHFEHSFTADTVSTVLYESIKRAETFESIYADFWGSAGTAFSIQLNVFDSLRNLKTASSFITSAAGIDTSFTLLKNTTDTVTCSLSCVAASPLNNKPNILLKAFNSNPLNNYLVVRATSQNALLHAWNSGGVDRYTAGGFVKSFKSHEPFTNMKPGDDNTIVGENGGTAKGIITVGAYATSFSWTDYKGNGQSTYAWPGYLAGFSSQGPTVDGRIKPDVVAPGVMISSAVNKYAVDSSMLTYISTAGGDTAYFGAMGGTSMASPQVCGIVALMLSVNPSLTNEQVRDILRATAQSDTFTKAVPNNIYGWGKVDGLAALQAVKNNLAIHTVTAGAGISIFPNPAQNTLNILTVNGAGIHAYTISTLQGQQLHSEYFTAPVSHITTDISSFAPGIYLVHITTPAGIVSQKFIRQ